MGVCYDADTIIKDLAHGIVCAENRLRNFDKDFLELKDWFSCKWFKITVQVPAHSSLNFIV